MFKVGFWSFGESCGISTQMQCCLMKKKAIITRQRGSWVLQRRICLSFFPTPPSTNLPSLVCFPVLCALLQVCWKQGLSNASMKKDTVSLLGGLGKIFQNAVTSQTGAVKRQNLSHSMEGWELRSLRSIGCMFLFWRSLLCDGGTFYTPWYLVFFMWRKSVYFMWCYIYFFQNTGKQMTWTND